jgi:hypothetical protein
MTGLDPKNPPGGGKKRPEKESKSGMNDCLRKPRPPQADQSALGIVAKKQGSPQ